METPAEWTRLAREAEALLYTRFHALLGTNGKTIDYVMDAKRDLGILSMLTDEAKVFAFALIKEYADTSLSAKRLDACFRKDPANKERIRRIMNRLRFMVGTWALEEVKRREVKP